MEKIDERKISFMMCVQLSEIESKNEPDKYSIAEKRIQDAVIEVFGFDRASGRGEI